jgi:hypothetical protein
MYIFKTFERGGIRVDMGILLDERPATGKAEFF